MGHSLGVGYPSSRLIPNESLRIRQQDTTVTTRSFLFVFFCFIVSFWVSNPQFFLTPSWVRNLSTLAVFEDVLHLVLDVFEWVSLWDVL